MMPPWALSLATVAVPGRLPDWSRRNPVTQASYSRSASAERAHLAHVAAAQAQLDGLAEQVGAVHGDELAHLARVRGQDAQADVVPAVELLDDGVRLRREAAGVDGEHVGADAEPRRPCR